MSENLLEDQMTEGTVEIVRDLSIFRPSDRERISRSFETSAGLRRILSALKIYIQSWERSDWIEEYRIERIGKWFAIAAPPDFVARIKHWAAQEPTNARKALIHGIDIGEKLSAEEKADILRKKG